MGSILIDGVPRSLTSGTTTRTSGCLSVAMSWQARQWPQGRSAGAASQFSAAANVRARVILPMWSGPVNR